VETVDYRTLEGIKKHPVYHLLTVKQQKFLDIYLETGGDRLRAAALAFTSNNNTDLSATRALSSAYTRELIAIYYGYRADLIPMSKDELLGILTARIRTEKDNRILVGLVDKYVKLTERKKRTPKKGRPTNETLLENSDIGSSEIDEIVRQIEEERRNKKVEA